jgi:hypothetical protein
MVRRLAWIELDGAGDEFNRLLVIPPLMRDHAEKVQFTGPDVAVPVSRHLK